MTTIPPPYRNTAYDNPEWVMFFDPDSADPYFYNTVTGDTEWEDPAPPAAMAAYQRVLEQTEDGEDREEDAERNFYLTSEIQSQIDRGIPPYLSEDWRTRPARKQAEPDTKRYAYKEGSEVYNIWYHKYTKDRFDPLIARQPALTQCDPWIDSGWTLADKKKSAEAFLCLWFARGCCSKGSGCQYRHRVPTRIDDRMNDQLVDIFGRERHANHKDDMGGVGAFTKECKCLYISELKFDRTKPDSVQILEAQIWKLFHPFGPIESVRVIPNRSIAFVRFAYRSAAEFAKVACADQTVGECEAINIRWAFEDPNPRAQEQSVIDTRDEFYRLIEQRITAMSLEERRDKGLIRTEVPDDGQEFIDKYELD
jgi:hypothetical protein